MDLNELKEIVIKILEEKGIEPNRKLKNGLELCIDETYRHNGTNTNKSLYIDVVVWSGCSGRVKSHKKINVNFSLKKINNIIDETIEIYRDYRR